MKTFRHQNFVRLLESISGDLCQVATLDPQVFSLQCGSRLKIYFYLHEAKTRITGSSSDQVYHIDEDLWLTQPDKLASRLRVLSGQATKRYARETVAARIDKQQAVSFQAAHHLQMPLKGKYRYGLFYQGDLVSVAVFSGARRMYDRGDEYRSFELLRFCHKGNQLVIGGLSKLIHKFSREHAPDDLMTYADRDWSDGSKLQEAGFILESELEPQDFWVEPLSGERYSKHHLPVDPIIRQRLHRKTNMGSLKMIKYFDR